MPPVLGIEQREKDALSENSILCTCSVRQSWDFLFDVGLFTARS